LKPNCVPIRDYIKIINNWVNSFKESFFKDFRGEGRRFIGQYEEGDSGGLPGL